MKYITLETAQRWITFLTAEPSPPTAEQLSSLAPSFGWEKTEFPEIYTHMTTSGPCMIQAPFDKQDGQLFRVSFSLADNPSDTLEGNIEIADLYIKYIEEAKQIWGTPCDFKTSTTSTIWRLQPRAFIEIYTHPDTIIFSLETIDPNNPR